MPHFHILTYALLVLGGAVAGVIDSIAGGGGLIAVPVLLMAGLSPAATLGTNRLQSIFGELTASLHYYRSGHMQLKRMWPVFIFTGLGAAVGSLLVQAITPRLLNQIIPILLLLVLIYKIFSGNLFKKPICVLPVFKFAVVCGTLIGFYNGFFGPGTGSFWIAAYIAFMGMSLQQAAINAKPANTVGNIVSVICFAAFLNINLAAAVAMSVGQIFGASLGARLVITRGDRVIKPIFIVVILLITLETLYRSFL